MAIKDAKNNGIKSNDCQLDCPESLYKDCINSS